jgi:DNA-binding NarL/FixJ family response regulator
MAKKLKVLMADDHVIVVEWQKHVLLADFDVVGTATDAISVLSQVKTLHPEVVVLDLFMPKMDGFSLCERLMQESSPPKIVFFTVDEQRVTAAKALQSGASGYVAKRDAQELALCVRAVATGRTYVSKSCV